MTIINTYNISIGAEIEALENKFVISQSKSVKTFVKNVLFFKDKNIVPDYKNISTTKNKMYDAYTKSQEALIENTGRTFLRISWDANAIPDHETHLQGCRWLTKTLDAYLGIPSVGWDRDDERRTLYGQAGKFIPRPWGMEYLTLSSAWINQPRFAVCVFENTMKAFTALFADPEVRNKEYYNKSAQNIINQNDFKTFGYIGKFNEIPTSKSYVEVANEIVASLDK